MVSTVITVKPAPSWIGRSVKLGPIDQIAPRCYMVTFLCFKLPQDVQAVHLAKRLQRMLSLTVQEIPQLSATVVECNNGREELGLQFFEAKGAYLVLKDFEASQNKHQWPHGNFDDLAKDHFPYKKLERCKLMDGLSRINERGELPSLMIQANLISGGLILVTAVHHAVCDGLGHYICNMIMAKHCHDTSSINTSASTIDFADRTTIIPPESNAQSSLLDLPDWKLVSQGAGEEFLNPIQSHGGQTPTTLSCAVYFISKRRIEELRDIAAASEDIGGQRPSAMVAISAILWQHVVRARNINCRDYPEAKLSLAVNTRPRMTEPAVSPFYWGNLSEPNAVARLPTSSFSSKTSQFLPTATRRVNTAIAAVDAPAVRRLVQVLGQLSKATELTWNVNRWPGPDMLIVSLLSSGYNDLDFGPTLGGYSKACRVQIGDIEGKIDGRTIILPPRREDEGGIEVMLQYEASTLKRLEADNEWAIWFERRN